MTKKMLYAVGVACAAVLLMGAAGDLFKAVMTDSAGNVVSTPLSFSNNLTLNATPSADRHLARMQDITNAAVVAAAVTNITGDTSILVSGTRVKALTWSNANAYVTQTVTNGLAPTSALSAYVQDTGDSISGPYYINGNASMAIGTNINTVSKFYVGGETGTYTNRPLVVFNRSNAANGNILEWRVGGVALGTIDINGKLSVTNMQCEGLADIKLPHYMAATTNTLTNPATNAANVITWTDIAHTYRFRTVGSKIYCDEVGTFLINASVIMKMGNAENTRGTLWFAVNGTNIPASSTQVEFPAVSGAATVSNVAQVISVPIVAHNTSTNDYLELYWWASSTDMTLPHTAALGTPTRPSCPAAIVTINKISSGADN